MDTLNRYGFLSFLISTSLLTACTLVQHRYAPSKIVGTWDWVQSTGGIGGWTITPDSAGYSHRQLILTSGYNFYLRQADTLAKAGSFVLENQNGDVVLHYKTNSESNMIAQRISFTSPDTLILWDECIDCYTHTYIRLQ